MQDPGEPETLTAAMDDLGRRGFTEHFTPMDGRLRAVNSAQTFAPDEITIAEYHRFEGVSDPDDMSILYALETRSGVRGTLVDAYGVYADPRVSALVQRARIITRARVPAALARRTGMDVEAA